VPRPFNDGTPIWSGDFAERPDPAPGIADRAVELTAVRTPRSARRWA